MHSPAQLGDQVALRQAPASPSSGGMRWPAAAASLDQASELAEGEATAQRANKAREEFSDDATEAGWSPNRDKDFGTAAKHAGAGNGDDAAGADGAPAAAVDRSPRPALGSYDLTALEADRNCWTRCQKRLRRRMDEAKSSQWVTKTTILLSLAALLFGSGYVTKHWKRDHAHASAGTMLYFLAALHLTAIPGMLLDWCISVLSESLSGTSRPAAFFDFYIASSFRGIVTHLTWSIVGLNCYDHVIEPHPKVGVEGCLAWWIIDTSECGTAITG